MRVLVVEDEVAMAEAIARGLRREGMAVDVAIDGDESWAKISDTPYDVIVLDRDLPGMSGDEICRRLLDDDDALTRVIMLTASATLDERVAGLALGADDYLTKPFEFRELVARIRALARRSVPAAQPVLTSGDLVLDPTRRTVHRGAVSIDLTHKEFGVLETLLQARGAVISTAELLAKVWDDKSDPLTTTVRVTMRSLRIKLGDPPVIDTVVKSGYRIAPPDVRTA